jgi:hypothetical protein
MKADCGTGRTDRKASLTPGHPLRHAGAVNSGTTSQSRALRLMTAALLNNRSVGRCAPARGWRKPRLQRAGSHRRSGQDAPGRVLWRAVGWPPGSVAQALTVQPLARNPRARARPRPREAPVMRTCCMAGIEADGCRKSQSLSGASESYLGASDRCPPSRSGSPTTSRRISGPTSQYCLAVVEIPIADERTLVMDPAQNSVNISPKTPEARKITRLSYFPWQAGWGGYFLC